LAQFDLTGGRTCLDFANTLGHRLESQPVEGITGYPDLVAFAVASEAIDAADAGQLLVEATRAPEDARAVWERALVLREALFEVFAAFASGVPPPAAALAAFNRELPEALAHLRIEATPEGCRWRWENQDGGLARVLWPVLRSAADLLASPSALAAVRLCASETCAWLFVDKSRNRSRRWCDMKVCGNRDKVRRHYRRARARQ
jgi:predicted RNA-binding Zn ribbon-like protein